MQFDRLKRREFITLLGGAAAVWPLAARAQQPERVRRIGMLMLVGEADPQAHAELAAFTTELQRLGWTEGQTVSDRLSLGGWRREPFAGLGSTAC